jgi:Lon protease-like protein
MSYLSSLPSQIPILPLYEQSVLFPGLLLRLRITAQTSTALLSHVLRSDQATLINLVLGCIPVRPGSGIAEIIGDGEIRPALPASHSKEPVATKPSRPEGEFGCTARIKSISRLDRSYGITGFVVVVEGTEMFDMC